MTTITHENNGFRIKFSNPGSGMRGFSVFATDLTEMKVTLDHYYGKPIHARNNCPLCRQDAARYNRKVARPTRRKNVAQGDSAQRTAIPASHDAAI